MKAPLAAAIAAALTIAGTVPALPAQGIPDPAAATGGPDLAALKRQIEAGEAAEAERTLRAADATTPGNADILNLLGYANRILARPGVSRSFYARALAIDPHHRGALEYMGELELETGDIPAARRLLVRLREICPSGCTELDDLIEAFEDRGIAWQEGDG